MNYKFQSVDRVQKEYQKKPSINLSKVELHDATVLHTPSAGYESLLPLEPPRGKYLRLLPLHSGTGAEGRRRELVLGEEAV